MARIVDNRLLLNSLLGVLLYWLFGMLTPDPYTASVAALVLILASGLLAYRYSRAVYAVVIRGDRGDKEDRGSHLAVYGAWLIAVGAFYTGVFTLIWLFANQPTSWTGTAVSSFGRALMASGFVLMYLTPDAMRGPIRAPNALLLLIMFLVAVAGAFVAGANFNGSDTTLVSRFVQFHGSDRPVCPDDRPVWGSTRGVYHPPQSIYRDMIIPVRCFRTIDEAVAAGFRKAN